MPYHFNPYRREADRMTVRHDRDGTDAAHLIGDIRRDNDDMPICYVYSHNAATRIVNALNAQEVHLASQPALRQPPRGHRDHERF